MAQWRRIRLGTMRLRVRSPASLSGLRIQCCYGCGVGQQAVVAPIQPLAWEPPYALSVALKNKTKQNKTKKKESERR